MLPESIPPIEPPVAHPDKIEEPESRKREATTYSGAFLQAGAITIGWALIIALLSTILGPIWIEGMVTMILVSQVVVVIVGIGVVTYSRNRNNETLLTRSYPEWPRMQKLLTLPDETIEDLFVEISVKIFQPIVFKNNGFVCPFRDLLLNLLTFSTQNDGGQSMGKALAELIGFPKHLIGYLSYFS